MYAVDADRLLLVASDRVSAFDVVMNELVPFKGATEGVRPRSPSGASILITSAPMSDISWLA